jgi:Fic family protein
MRFEGGEFGYCPTPLFNEPLLLIDRAASIDAGRMHSPRSLQKRLLASHQDGQLVPQRRVLASMNEAAESSIMEGASTTRKDAVELLRSGREPGTIGERMIVNNYAAMQRLKQDVEKELSTDLLLEWHEVLTTGTLDPSCVARLRRADEPVRIDDSRTNETIFTPPPVEFLHALLRSICTFANADHSGPAFIHPVAKAAILHFALGYAHPFVDGNGRTARAAFYWCALRHGYNIFEFCSISEIIRKGYSRYPQAFLDVEQDDGDLSYFIAYMLDVIQHALERFATHLELERERISRSEELLVLAADLNLRQRLLLEHALRHPLTQYTVKSHMNSNGITPNTSRADLESLVQRRLLVTSKRGKQVLYLLAPGVASRLEKAIRKRS